MAIKTAEYLQRHWFEAGRHVMTSNLEMAGQMIGCALLAGTNTRTAYAPHSDKLNT